MKVAVFYSTNRKKATVKVVKWLEEAIRAKGHEVSVGKPAEFSSLDCDLIIIGSSVYERKIVDEIVDFVSSNDKLKGKNIATFLVCKETRNPILAKRIKKMTPKTLTLK